MDRGPVTDSRKGQVLVVDLDGTLIATDMLYETFWAAFARDWRTPFAALRALAQGRAQLKAALAGRADVDVALLPFNTEALAYVEDWRAEGGRVALVTASDQSVAERVAEHLGLFDEVIGSDGQRNLKGEAKSALLAERFGPGRYTYMGDGPADLSVWRDADKAVTVSAPSGLRRRVEALGGEVEHLAPSEPAIRPYLKAIRPNQWLKNVLVFLPVIAGHAAAGVTLLQAIAAFVVFSMVASAVYVLNDLLDLSADRAHPRKRERPFAAGRVPIAHGALMAPALLLGGFLLALTLGWAFVAVMAVYFATTTAYSLVLKRLVIFDILTLAALYTLRIVAGAVATGIPLSVWLLAFSMFFFFAMAAVKRQAELVDGAHRGADKAVGRGYRVSDLPMVAQMATASGYVSVLVLVLYLNSPDVRDLYSQPFMLWGMAAVLLYWLSHIFIVTHRGGMHDDPVVYAVRDRHSLVCAALIAGFAIGGTLL